MTPALLVAATKAVASAAPILKDDNAGLLPDVENVRDISVEIAAAVIKQAIEDGLAQQEEIPENDDVLKDWIREQMWDPVYREMKKVHPEDATKAAKGQVGTGRSH